MESMQEPTRNISMKLVDENLTEQYNMYVIEENIPSISRPPTRVTRVTFITKTDHYIDYAEMPGMNATILLSAPNGDQVGMNYECFSIESARKTLNMLVEMTEATLYS